MKGCSVFITWTGLFFDLQHQTIVKLKVSRYDFIATECLFMCLLLPSPSLLDSLSLSADYVIEFEDQGSKERGWEELKRVTGSKERVSLPLWPYVSYRFRVIAINYVGKSGPSKPSEIHNTPAEGLSRCFVTTNIHSPSEPGIDDNLLSPPPITAPDNNPEDVRSESNDPDTLVITWEVHLLPECTNYLKLI